MSASAPARLDWRLFPGLERLARLGEGRGGGILDAVPRRQLNLGQLDDRARAVALEPERLEVRRRELEDAHDVRRERQDDVGLRRFLVGVGEQAPDEREVDQSGQDRKSTRLNSSHLGSSYA